MKEISEGFVFVMRLERRRGYNWGSSHELIFDMLVTLANDLSLMLAE